MVTRSIESAGVHGAAAQLSTPSDIDRHGAEEIARALNPVIADAIALYVKTKNFHWHLAGPHFRDYHMLFDEQAEAIFASIDPLAERLRRIGATTIRSIGHVGELTKVADDNEQYVPAEEMVRRLMEDNRGMAKRQREALALCDKYDDHATSNILEEILNGTERRVWFLFEVLQGEAPRPKPHRAA